MLKVSCSRQGASGGQETRDPWLFSCLPQVLPANNDDSDNKSASDLSDSELCGVASASKPTVSEREIFHRFVSLSKGEAAVRKHAQYFTPVYNRNRNVYFTASCRADKYNPPFLFQVFLIKSKMSNIHKSVSMK